MVDPAGAGDFETPDEGSVLRDVVILRWTYRLRDLLEWSLRTTPIAASPAIVPGRSATMPPSVESRW
jgi:hypothetical protein